MPRTVLLVAAIGLLLPLTTARSAPRCDPDGAGAADVRAVAEGIVAADNARDIERVIGYYAPRATLMPLGEPPVTGHEAIRPRYEQLFRSFDPQIEARIDEVCVDGALAVVRGHNGGKLVPRGGGEPRTLDDVYLMVLERDDERRWHIRHLMWHPASRR